jgi:membrane protein implicated in regulation of membrane protease activity
MDAYWGWWIAAAVLAGAELVTNTFYLLAIAVALAAGGIAAFLGLPDEWQWAVAVALGIVLTFVAHRWRARRMQPGPQVQADIGNSVRVRHWNPDGSARVDYRGTQWTAELATPDTPRRESRLVVADRPA